MLIKNFSRLFLIALFLVGIVWLLASKINFPSLTIDHSIEHSDVRLNPSIPQRLQTVPVSKKVSSTQFDDWKSTWTSVEADEQADWFRRHGDFSFSGGNDYDSYDMSTLQKLAESDDLQAIHALAKLYLNEKYGTEYGFKYAEPLYWKAAALGSTTALTELANIHDTMHRFGQYTDEEKRTATLEALALHKVAALRGDRFGLITLGRAMLDNNGVRDMSKSEEAFVNNRVHQIYLDLQTKRSEFGLDKFDNSAPDSVKRYFDMLEHK